MKHQSLESDDHPSWWEDTDPPNNPSGWVAPRKRGREEDSQKRHAAFHYHVRWLPS